MLRRRLLGLGTAATAWLVLSGHTPYRQWKVYRQKHLLIGSSKSDPKSYELATQIARTLVRWLPESSARVSRAPDLRRVASLLASDQWQVSVLGRQAAADLATGRGGFAGMGAVPLRGMFAMGGHVLVCRPHFPHRHGWLVAATLSENASEIPGGAALRSAGDAIPVHAGAKAYAAGAPLPEAPAPVASETSRGHSH